GVDQRHAGPGDGRRAGAAVGTNHVAIDVNVVLAQTLQIDGGPQRAPDQPLDLQRPTALLAPAGLTLHALSGRTRQHAVLGGDPTLTGTTQKARARESVEAA